MPRTEATFQRRSRRNSTAARRAARDRRDIFTGLESALGEGIANKIMQLLPSKPADQLVTRTDMHTFGVGLRGEMAELRGELHGEMADLRAELRGDMQELRTELRTEMVELRTDLHQDMQELRTELRVDMAELRADVRSEIAKLRVDTQRFMAGAVAANTIAVVTALLT